MNVSPERNFLGGALSNVGARWLCNYYSGRRNLIGPVM